MIILFLFIMAKAPANYTRKAAALIGQKKSTSTARRGRSVHFVRIDTDTELR